MICPTCHGVQMLREEPCPECQGSGIVHCCEGANVDLAPRKKPDLLRWRGAFRAAETDEDSL